MICHLMPLSFFDLLFDMRDLDGYLLQLDSLLIF